MRRNKEVNSTIMDYLAVYNFIDVLFRSVHFCNRTNMSQTFFLDLAEIASHKPYLANMYNRCRSAHPSNSIRGFFLLFMSQLYVYSSENIRNICWHSLANSLRCYIHSQSCLYIQVLLCVVNLMTGVVQQLHCLH